MKTTLFIFFFLAIFGCAGPDTNRRWIVSPEYLAKQSFPVYTEVKVNSEPQGAKVYVNDVYQGTTPIVAKLEGRIERYYSERTIKYPHREDIDVIRELGNFGKAEYSEVIVYKEGYKRKSNKFYTNAEWVKNSEDWKLFENMGRVDSNYTRELVRKKFGDAGIWFQGKVEWTAFLEKDIHPSMMQQQQQQQQIIIEKPKAVSYLSVSSDPSDAEVYLDGNLIGTTPINNMKLNPGNYRLKVTKGSKTWERNIMIPEEGSLQIKAKPE